MLSSANIKLIRSLAIKKYREKHGLYIIEGDKLVREYLEKKIPLKMLIAEPGWLAKTGSELLSSAETVTEAGLNEMKKISNLKTPPGSMAIVRTEPVGIEDIETTGCLSIVLEDIRDPGNLGSMIRIAAWFGIENIICSPDTADVYNPKTVQAAMGALLHVKIIYTPLVQFLKSINPGFPVYAATLSGRSLYEIRLESEGLLLFGNESRGLSGEILGFAGSRITIPPQNMAGAGVDSLNIAMSAAVICSEFRRRQNTG